MLIAEHEEAEILRHARLRTHAPQRAHGFSIRWLFAMLGWRDVVRLFAMRQSSIDF